MGCHTVGLARAGGGLGKSAGRTKHDAALPDSTMLNACSTIEVHAAITIHVSCQHQTTSRQPMMHARRAAACLPLPRNPSAAAQARACACARRALRLRGDAAGSQAEGCGGTPRASGGRRGDGGRPSSWSRGGKGACRRGTPTPGLRQQLERGSLFKADGRPADDPLIADLRRHHASSTARNRHKPGIAFGLPAHLFTGEV